jgi:signal transduction histidine kinase
MPTALISYGVRPAIEDLFRGLSTSSGINVNYTICSNLSLDEKLAIAVYRVLQECINNTLKYAKAKAITLDIIDVGGAFKIEYSDDGQGFNLANTDGHGIGLSNMASRIEMIGGNFEIVSKLGEGTSIYFSIPDHAEYNQVAFG